MRTDAGPAAAERTARGVAAKTSRMAAKAATVSTAESAGVTTATATLRPDGHRKEESKRRNGSQATHTPSL